jgi:hypothetical protein
LLVELPLLGSDVKTILRAADNDLLLVGGQALAHWLRFYEVEPPAPLVEFITTDVDFLGSQLDGTSLQRKLGQGWELRLATLDDAGGQSAKLFRKTADGVQQIDFLTGLAGLQTAVIQKRALPLEVGPSHVLRVLHPLDVFESRLRNLDILPSKRTPAGVAQAEAAVRMIRKAIETEIKSNEREGLWLFEETAALVLDRKLSRVGFEYSLGLQRALPFEVVASEAFKRKRWPQLLAKLQESARKYADLVERRAALKHRKTPH